MIAEYDNNKEIEGYDLFREQVMRKQDDLEHIPLEIDSVRFEDMSETELKEQQEVYKSLEDYYCTCNHRDSKHYNKVGKCGFKSTRFWNGKIQPFQCECPTFTSRKKRREREEKELETENK